MKLISGLCFILILQLVFVTWITILSSQQTQNRPIKFKSSYVFSQSFRESMKEYLKVPKTLNSVNDVQTTVALQPSNSNQFQINVTIYAKYRTGSTFISELFNRNPSAFYTYEPLKLAALNTDESDEERSRYLPEIFNCNLSSLVKKANTLSNQDFVEGWVHKALNWEFKGSKAFHRVCISCREAECLRRKLRVAKLISMRNLESLIKLGDSYIIHLVRDPRGVISSRTKIKIEEENFQYSGNISSLDERSYIKGAAEFYCSNLDHDLSLLKDLGEADLQRYRLLRYEDAALFPKVIASLVYSFVRMPLPEEVIEWISRSTQAKKDTSAYSTRRNSPEAAFAWKDYFPPEHMQIIEEECEGVMRVLGYEAMRGKNITLGHPTLPKHLVFNPS